MNKIHVQKESKNLKSYEIKKTEFIEQEIYFLIHFDDIRRISNNLEF